MNPPHLGELVRESMDETGWNVTETAVRLGCERGRLSRLLNGRAGLSADMALALEHIGWGTADHWMRMQAASFCLVTASLEVHRRLIVDWSWREWQVQEGRGAIGGGSQHLLGLIQFRGRFNSAASRAERRVSALLS